MDDDDRLMDGLMKSGREGGGIDGKLSGSMDICTGEWEDREVDTPVGGCMAGGKGGGSALGANKTD